MGAANSSRLWIWTLGLTQSHSQSHRNSCIRHVINCICRFLFVLCHSLKLTNYSCGLLETVYQILVLPRYLAESIVWNRTANDKGWVIKETWYYDILTYWWQLHVHIKLDWLPRLKMACITCYVVWLVVWVLHLFWVGVSSAAETYSKQFEHWNYVTAWSAFVLDDCDMLYLVTQDTVHA